MDKPIPEDVLTFAGKVSHPEVWEPTTRLRWSRDSALQQAWYCQTTGATEWVDVPTEEGE